MMCPGSDGYRRKRYSCIRWFAVFGIPSASTLHDMLFVPLVWVNGYIGAAKLGMRYVGIGPRELSPDPAVMDEIKSRARTSGAEIEYTDSIETAVAGADVIYSDVWVSMGEEERFEERITLLRPYQVTMEVLR